MINKTPAPDVKPFTGLAPEVVLDAAAAAGFDTDGRLFALNSYENRVYQVGVAAGSLVLKFYRPGRWSDAQIEEEHAFTTQLAAAELPVAAPLAVDGRTLLRFQAFRFAAFPWMRGRAPELDATDSRQILGRTLARLHQVGALQKFAHRPPISLERLGIEACHRVMEGELLPARLQERYIEAAEPLLAGIDAAFEAARDIPRVRLHGDCHLGNLLWNENGPAFVDLDDCAAGPRVQDLWMLLSGGPDDQRRQWSQLCEGYRQFGDLDPREVRLIEPLRALRMLHHAAWVTHRWQDPAFPRAFPWFGEERYWEGYVGDLREQLESLDAPPLSAR